MIRIPRQLFLYVQAAILFLFAAPGLASETERPFIWVKSTDKPAILKKIEEQSWARSLFVELRVRADEAASTTVAERREKLLALPLVWPGGEDSPPALVIFPRKDPFADGRKEQATAITKGLQDGIDCGVLFYLTGQEHYAECATDILFTFVNALAQTEANRDYTTNGGWLYQGDHLREVRIVSAQLPIIYDFVQPWLKEGGKAYDLASGELRAFDFEAMQDVFRTYIWLALNHGLYASNWPALESPGLVHNILGLDDVEERADTLPYYLSKDTEHKFEHWSRGQPSLNRMAGMFKSPGDVWPESLGYSVHVASNLIYVMTVFDRLYPNLGLGKRYRNILAALTSYYDLRFPNGDTPYIGDGSRRQHVSFHTYEKALQLAVLNNNTDQAETFGNLLAASMTSGQYDRAVLAPRNYGWSHYLTPLQLLWSLEDPGGDPLSDAAPPHPRTNHLPHAGLYIQRIVSETEPVKGSLMAYVAGGSYIHGHASGMEMELYGQGHVLGINNGSSTYGTAIHENYYRLFAAKNTVISNGASASSGGWIELGINTVTPVAMEPAPNQLAVSPNHSFSTTAFHDEHNLVAPADHQRTVALVRLSDSSGFYLDVFRARSDTPDQYHDYVYHNVGGTLLIQSDGRPLPMTGDPERFQAPAKISWELQGNFQHPGWHYFEDVKTGKQTDRAYEAVFTAAELGDVPIHMRAMIPGGLGTEMTQVNGPPSKGAPESYRKKPLPAFVMRHEGDTWDNPFVAVYESYGEKPSVQSVERLMSDNVFKGVKVVTSVDGRRQTQYILLQENPGDSFDDKETGIAFTGRFGVVSVDQDGSLRELYIGDGERLTFDTISLSTPPGARAAYRCLLNTPCEVAPKEPSIIPLPQQFLVKEGTFSINSSTRACLSGENRELKSAAEYFAGLIRQSGGIELPIGQLSSCKDQVNAILLVLEDRGLGAEGYELVVSKNGIQITAKTPQGIFYGLQSVRQLLPPQIESSGRVEGLELRVPFVQIKDRPRYGWRGLMLDESRHFFGKAYVKKLLEQMAMLKMNVFHWHLTDAPGWRMEVEKYPKLTSIGGVGNKSDPKAPAAFYTQDDVREIITYAAERHIQVLPEIDMPGHATAANRAYPEHSGGGNEKRPDFTFNPGRQETYSYLTDILEETATLFPAPWIHYGGDEVHFANGQWIDIPEVKTLMAEHGLKNLKEVEHYFNRRMADEIDRLGKKTVAWDEVVDAGTDPDKTIIIWWRHNIPEQLSKALDKGFDVVLSPRRPLYFDFVQDDSHQVGRRWDGFNDLEQVYEYPNIPANYPEKHHKQILGMQASMWSETVQTSERCDFMIFPRLTALAEAAWTDFSNKDYENYQLRLKSMLERYDVLEINYFDPFAPEKTPEPQH